MIILEVQMSRPVVAAAALALASTVWATASPRAPGARGETASLRLTATPTHTLVDEPVEIRLTGARAGELVTLEAATRDRAGTRWRSSVTLRANRAGVVDTHSHMRLFWSMRPPRGSAVPTFFAFSRGDMAFRLRASLEGKRTASTTIFRRVEARDLVKQDLSLAREGFVGTYYAPPSTPASAPAVLQIGGSIGGHGEFPAVLLASHGYPSLSVAYFKEPGLPGTLKDIPLEYFAEALTWLAAQPGVDARRLVVLGISRGAEAALLLGATFPNLVHGVVSCTGSSEVLGAFPGPGAAWTLRGKPVPPGPLMVEKVGGPVLAFGGGKDAIGPSAQAVRAIVSRARSHGRRDVVGRVYPQAGHGIGCIVPNVPLANAVRIGPSTYVATGGTPSSNEQAAARSWPLVPKFLSNLPRKR
jgi:dienelactone hydrolase